MVFSPPFQAFPEMTGYRGHFPDIAMAKFPISRYRDLSMCLPGNGIKLPSQALCLQLLLIQLHPQLHQSFILFINYKVFVFYNIRRAEPLSRFTVYHAK